MSLSLMNSHRQPLGWLVLVVVAALLAVLALHPAISNSGGTELSAAEEQSFVGAGRWSKVAIGLGIVAVVVGACMLGPAVPVIVAGKATAAVVVAALEGGGLIAGGLGSIAVGARGLSD